ncbi:ABC transporter permease [Sediminispirochaeta smaragdinae]|jgi:ABC-type nitrate/sulfonate/bicarbonate transport system permease component|uniref:Binding-protein-dependent transport systems inner membrane component n=1 Tax=Sediminispirochaeta smaragdinae (strain DSM 11293 / JCM 15392 / SEBR 4228) TaxID=573413 RepID=E1R9H6_SEDSS|nr:ABC transporter permease subunit [Sediminispirochaeta smaragdinae]ADK83145.1 binding-protein-dependent transport systems inner membrane component [Sediminispirochaeta smaragdinae DSM 11293]
MMGKTKASVTALVLVIGVWGILSFIYPPLVIPTIPSVCVKIVEIMTHADMLQIILVSFTRLITALTVGTIAGFAIGILCGKFTVFREITGPLIGVLQVIPPVALLILAILWFGFNGKPAIFIASMAIFPIMVISVQHGIMNIDPKTLEMGETFRLTKRSMFLDIIIPSIRPSLTSGWRISLGLACKTMVMGEVLTTPTGIGGALSQARMNLEPETVIAWTVITVLIFYVIDWLTKGKRHA